MKSTILSILVLAAIVCFTACKNEKKEEAAPAPTEAPAAPAATEIQATPPPPQQSPEPAQNTKGVWHYTCAKGCEGGSGTQGTCAKCGGPLQHNTAYHAQ